INCDPSQAKIVGVEGVGEKPPYYDPAALQGGRIILANFSTEPALPSGRVLVARVHFQETGAPVYTPTLMAAAAPGGERLEPTIELVRAGGKWCGSECWPAWRSSRCLFGAAVSPR